VQYTIGQVEIFAFNFAPVGFMACQASSCRSIMQYQALFSLIGPNMAAAAPPISPCRNWHRSHPKVRSGTSALRAAASRAGPS
jgi:hypothetical protein